MPTPGIPTPVPMSMGESAPATYGQMLKMFSRTRNDSFQLGHGKNMKPYTATDVNTIHTVNYTKNPAGTEVTRGIAGVGEFVVNPMEKFKDDVKVDHPYKRTSIANNPSEGSTARIRSKGVSAYKKAGN